MLKSRFYARYLAMKKITLVFSIFLALEFHNTALANTWANLVLSCDGARVEDICWDAPNQPIINCRRQLFVYGDYEKNFFLNRGMIFPNAKGEAILPALAKIPDSLDMKDETFAYSMNGRILYVKPIGNILRVESFLTTQPSGGIYIQQEKILSYDLVNCH